MTTYTIFIGSSYHKSFSNKIKAQREVSMLRRDGAKRVRISTTKD